MNIANGRKIFVNSTTDDFRHNLPKRHTSRTSAVGRQQEREDGPSDQLRNYDRIDMHADIADLQTLKRVLGVLKEGKMDVAGFLDALCWGNRPAIADPTVKAAGTILTHSDQLATVVSRLLHPPRTSQGGSTAEGARQGLLPLAIDTVKEVIKKAMDALVEELKEESADVTEQSVLGTVIDEV
jgi:hypothetical protein